MTTLTPAMSWCGVRRWMAGVLFVLAMLCLAGTASAQTLQQTQGSNFGTWSVGEVQTELRATGGNGPGTYVWSVVSGSLPPGTAVRTDQPSWFSSSASAGIIGIATTPGTYNFTLRVTSGAAFVDQPSTIRITSLSIDNYWTLPDAFTGKFYSQQFTSTNGSGTWSVTTGLPPGMSMSASGLLSGTPTQAGFFNPQVRLVSGVDTIFSTMNINVSALQITTPALLPLATQNVAYSANVNASGGTGPYTFTAGNNNLPNGLVLDPSGAITGTPTNTNGSFSLFVTVTDSALPTHNSYSKRMLLEVLNPPQGLPQISPYRADFCTLGLPCERGLSVFAGVAPYTWAASGLPPGMSIRFGEGNMAFSYPYQVEIVGAPTQTGTFDAQVTATDSLGQSTTNTFPIRVAAIERNDSTKLPSNFLPTGTLNVLYTGGVRLIGGRQPYSVTSIIGGALPGGLTFDTSTFAVSGTPVEQGFFSEQVEFSDADGVKLESSLFITINGAPGTTVSINNGSNLGSRTINLSTSTTLSACCVPSFVWSVVNPLALPPGMALSSGGILSGTPTALGTYVFLVQAADATNLANFAQRQFTLTVVNPGTLFVTTGNLPFGNVGTPY